MNAGNQIRRVPVEGVHVRGVHTAPVPQQQGSMGIGVSQLYRVFQADEAASQCIADAVLRKKA